MKKAVEKKAHRILPGPAEPIYIPLPPEGVLEPWSGLQRGKLKTLIMPALCHGKPPVQSIVLPNTGKNKRGTRLIIWKSLKAYLERLRAEQNEQAA